MKTSLMVVVIAFAGSAGDILLTKGMKQVGEVRMSKIRRFLRAARRTVTNSFFLMGLTCMAVSFFAFLAVLSWADMSLVVPATSLSFVVSTVGARLILKERIGKLRWVGIGFVGLGIALISIPG